MALVPLSLLACICLLLAGPASAQNESDVQIHQGFPRDCIAYASLNLTGSLSAFYDFKAMTSAGAVGIADEDMAAMVSKFLLPDSNILREGKLFERLIYGAKRVSGAIVDIDASIQSFFFRAGSNDFTKWMIAAEHESPEDFIAFLKEADEAKIVAFKEIDNFDGHQLYSVQVPKDWTRTALSGGFGGWGPRFDDELTDPLLISVWNQRFVVVSPNASYVKDALTFWDFPEDDEESLSGQPSFRKNWKKYGSRDGFFYLGISALLLRIERIIGGSESPETLREFQSYISIGELKQLDALVMSAHYDGGVGVVDASTMITFRDKPGWISALPYDPGAIPLTEFAPADTMYYSGLRIGEPGEAFQRIVKFVKEKATAMGYPSFSREMDTSLAEVEKELGVTFDNLFSVLNGEAALAMPIPYTDKGFERENWPYYAVMFGLTDEAKAKEVIQTSLRNSSNEEFRSRFLESADISYVEAKDGRRVRYTSFNSMDNSSWSYAVFDGAFVFGPKVQVENIIRAKLEGNNLASLKRYQEFRKQLPEKIQYISYFNLEFLGKYADQVVGTSGANANEFNKIRIDPLGLNDAKSNSSQLYVPYQAAQKLNESLLKRYFGNMDAAIIGEIGDDRIELSMKVSGLPLREGITAMAVELSQHSNRNQAFERLSRDVVPAVENHLFTNGDLPQSMSEYAGAGGDLELVRDPTVAGPGKKDLTEDDCFVWLGRHEEIDLTKPVPLCHSRQEDIEGRFLLLMSDSSIHLVTKEELDDALSASRKGEVPFSLNQPQTLKALVEDIANKQAK